jgi:hypothetical protein
MSESNRDTCCGGEKLTVGRLFRYMHCGVPCWMSLIVWAYAIIFMVVAVYAAVRFFGTEQVGSKLFYAALFLTAVMMATITKIWSWMVINRVIIERRLDRIESKIDELAGGDKGD